MAKSNNFPLENELRDLPICDHEDALKYYADESIKRKEGGKSGPFRMLVPAPLFADLVEALADFKMSPRLLKAWASLKLIAPTVEKEGRKDLYVYPDHFEQASVILTLRYGYHLPLKTIQLTLPQSLIQFS